MILRGTQLCNSVYDWLGFVDRSGFLQAQENHADTHQCCDAHRYPVSEISLRVADTRMVELSDSFARNLRRRSQVDVSGLPGPNVAMREVSRTKLL